MLGYARVELESGSLDAVRLINDNERDSHPSAALLCDITSILEGQWDCRISRVFKEANMLADCIAKLGHLGSLEDETLLANPPPEAAELCKADTESWRYAEYVMQTEEYDIGNREGICRICHHKL
ncbi:hypothetical protein LINGRAHAP2_LOCUS12273 [Linum grandiflorum]